MVTETLYCQQKAWLSLDFSCANIDGELPLYSGVIQYYLVSTYLALVFFSLCVYRESITLYQFSIRRRG